MKSLEQRIASLEEFKQLRHARPMSDAELAVRLYWACNGPAPIDERLLKIVPQLADHTALAVKAHPS